MTRSAIALLVALSGPLCGALQGGNYGISGVLVDHRSNAPIPSAFVSIVPVNGTRMDAASIIPAALTNSSGQFHFANLPAGKYTLLAQRRGSGQYLYHGHGQFSTAIVTGPNLDSEHILFALPAPAYLSGKVIDEDNDAVPDSAVWLLKKVVVDGHPIIQQLQQQISGSSGRFHFGPLRPGVFYLAVVAKPWYASHDDGSRYADASTRQTVARDVAYPVTYSGDTTDAASASPILIEEGTDGALTVTLRPVPALHIPFSTLDPNGTAQDPTFSPAHQFMESIAAIGPGGTVLTVPLETQSTSAMGSQPATVEMVGLAPGTYRLVRQSTQANGLRVTSTEDVSLTNNEFLGRPKTPSVSISGRVILGDIKTPANNTRFAISFTNVQTQTAETVFSGSDGAFSLNGGLPPGSYQLVIDNPPGLAVQAISEGSGPNTPGNVLGVPRNRSTLNDLILHAGNAGITSLEGIVTANGKPMMAATVLLLPANLKGANPIGRDQSDSDGSFTIPNVTAGQYRLLAIEEPANGAAEDLAYRDEHALAPYWAKALRITVNSRAEGKPLQVEVQRRVAATDR